MTSNAHKVSGKVLQKKYIQLSDNSSADFDNQQIIAAKTHQKIDLSGGSLDLRNLQFNKFIIGKNPLPG